ncbi:MAG: glycoside hydrolase family 2 TIM barrel-domain containing protein [bacterium]|nr:glycoside hydrolase family 2 TIM barrel-domain containing protein [bacterium]
MRSVIPFNRDWLYTPAQVSEDTPDSTFQAIDLPHTNIELPHHNFDNADYQFISTYRKHFRLPEPLNGRRLFIDFDGVMIAATVIVNGRRYGEHGGGYVPFSFDITDAIHPDGDNVITVLVDSTERPDIPPYGYVVDYLTFGGIYRDVSLRYVEPVHIDKVFVRTLDVLTAPRVEIDVWVKNHGDQARTVSLNAAVEYGEGAAIDGGAVVSVAAGAPQQYTLALSTGGSFRLWTLDQPERYAAFITLSDSADRQAALDEQEILFGFREAIFKDDGFYLNGEKLQLIGLNRHQTYPYIGAGAPARLQRKDADILKFELGLNLVRTSHYPQSPHFLDRCDEIGLLVFEEIPGWQFIGDSDWKALSLRDVQAMIERDRNHPSIILWGVRINESWDDEAFYKATNALAHQLDPTRQTGGVRYFMESQFLEDVFTFNDFSKGVRDPIHTPHLITEFNGHMFPTKTFDQEERQIEHAHRHALIQDLAFANPRVTGAIGWCAFDYNTHREFGSGDRICYHGVSDMFRLPKWAAFVYASQVEPAVRPVLHVLSLWTMGDRSEGGCDPLMIATNCDYVDIWAGDQQLGRFLPDRERYPHLPHAPITAHGGTQLGVWGKAYQDLRVVGYVNDQPAAEQRIAADGVPQRLELTADDDAIHADGSDMTRLVFRITDAFGNRLPFATAVIQFSIEGEGVLVGENPFPLVGGQAAVYVRAARQPGTIRVTAASLTAYKHLQPASVTIRVE